MMIYISGAITGTSNYKERFYKAECYLIGQGNNPVNPVSISETLQTDYDELPTWADYMKAAIQGMMKCDSIYMLKDWEKSKGAVIEHELAVKLNYKIFYE